MSNYTMTPTVLVTPKNGSGMMDAFTLLLPLALAASVLLSCSQWADWWLLAPDTRHQTVGLGSQCHFKSGYLKIPSRIKLTLEFTKFVSFFWGIWFKRSAHVHSRTLCQFYAPTRTRPAVLGKGRSRTLWKGPSLGWGCLEYIFGRYNLYAHCKLQSYVLILDSRVSKKSDCRHVWKNFGKCLV